MTLYDITAKMFFGFEYLELCTTYICTLPQTDR